MIKTFKTRIYPTINQVKYFRNAFGVRRWTWNWAWNEWQKQPTSQFSLQKQLNNGLIKDSDFKWLSEVNSMIRQEALKDLFLSIKAWKDPKRKTSKQPHYASKKTTPLSFRIIRKNKTAILYDSPHYISFVGVGKKRIKVKTAESVRFLKSADFKTLTVSEKAGYFYIAITYEMKAKSRKIPSNRGKAGIDMGIKTPLVVYDNLGSEYIEITIKEELRKAERRTETLQRALSRKQEARKKCSGKLKRDSKRYQALKLRLQCAYMHEANIKHEWREQMTWLLVSSYSEIAIEPYTSQSANNLNCNRAARRAGGYEFCERLKIKAAEYGTQIIWVSWEPTTQTCSECGYRLTGNQKLTLSDRKFICPYCGFEIDRDANAARNIYNLI